MSTLTQELFDTVPSVPPPSAYVDEERFDDIFPFHEMLDGNDLNLSPSTVASLSVDRETSM